MTSVAGNNEKTCYEYDPKNRLISEKRQTGTGAARLVQKNAYNGDGLRVSREEPDAQNPAGSSAVTNYFYRQGNLSYTTDAKGAVTSKYLYGNGDGVIAREETLDDAKVYSFYTKDIKGSTMSLLNENGQHAVSYVYDDFGKTDIKPAAGNTDRRGETNEICYTGGVYDRTTEQYYLNARYYSPDGGNFLTQEQLPGNAGG